MSTRSTDIAAIEAVIADHERGYNTKDPDLLAAHYSERSWSVGVNGVEIEGQPALVAAAKAAFSGPLAEGKARYRPGAVQFLGEDVAMCHMYSTAITNDGELTGPDPAMIALYVFHREGGSGRLSHGRTRSCSSRVDSRHVRGRRGASRRSHCGFHPPRSRCLATRTNHGRKVAITCQVEGCDCFFDQPRPRP
jgi:uncharacterized protein (TIGR02246 family)